MKIRTISSIEEIDNLVASVTQSANKALEQVSQLGLSDDGLKALWSMKTQPIGCNPLNSEVPLNLIEQQIYRSINFGKQFAVPFAL